MIRLLLEARDPGDRRRARRRRAAQRGRRHVHGRRTKPPPIRWPGPGTCCRRRPRSKRGCMPSWLRCSAAACRPSTTCRASSYTRAVFEEAIRLYPPVPLLGRQASRDETIRNRPHPGGLAGGRGAVAAASPPAAVGPARPFHPGTVPAGERRLAPALQLYSVQRRAAGLRRPAFGLTEAILCIATLAQRARLRLAPGDRRRADLPPDACGPARRCRCWSSPGELARPCATGRRRPARGGLRWAGGCARGARYWIRDPLLGALNFALLYGCRCCRSTGVRRSAPLSAPSTGDTAFRPSANGRGAVICELAGGDADPDGCRTGGDAALRQHRPDDARIRGPRPAVAGGPHRDRGREHLRRRARRRPAGHRDGAASRQLGGHRADDDRPVAAASKGRVLSCRRATGSST